MKRIHLFISGDVHGVGFRAWVVLQTQHTSITGWVSNRKDGSVEVVAEGKERELKKLIEACKHGPDVSWVESVDVHWMNPTHEFEAFKVIY